MRLRVNCRKSRPFGRASNCAVSRPFRGAVPHSYTENASSGLVLGVLLPFLAFAPACDARDATPYEEARSIAYGPTADGRVRSCPSNVNPNCVSTASTNQSYSPAWRATQSSAVDAAAALETAVLSLYSDVQLENTADLGTAKYLAFSTPGLYGRDIFEFVIRPEGVTNRNWEGDSSGALVTYRSMAGGVKYIWPIQQPLSDFGAQKKRMDEIRERVGWKLIGCELIECYETGPEPLFQLFSR